MTKQIKAKIPESWVIEVEETQKLGYGNGILVFRDSNTNQKIYVKLCKPEDIQKGLIFEFIDPSYLRSLGLEESCIEESFNASLHKKPQLPEREFEESEQGKMTDVEYENWKKEQQRLLAEQKQKASNLTININTDKKPEGETSEEPEFNLEQKQIELFQKFNDDRVFDMKTKAELVDFTTNLVNEGLEAKKPKPETPSGSMPLNDFQSGIKEFGKEGYENETEMIADLKKREQNGDVNAKRILGILYSKMAKGLRKKGVEFEADEDDQPLLKDLVKKKERE